MKRCSELINLISTGKFDGTFEFLYKEGIESQRGRYISLLELFIGEFGDMHAIISSAPGRTEIGGNHTDHQHGNVLAASINLDTICIAAPNNSNIIRVQSIGYPLDEVNTDALQKQIGEEGKTASLIRGVANYFKNLGVEIGGFNAYISTNVLVGSGLSSSAAFEVLIGTVISRLFAPEITAEQIAIAGQYAENEFFGKPCGLMDQMASSLGGVVQIDFKDPQKPLVKPIKFNIRDYGYNLCIVNTKGSHENLTPDYAAIPNEMRQIAEFFGKGYLRDVEEGAFYGNLSALRENNSDRAILRAMHFYKDNSLAIESASALENADFEKFLSNINKSGESSFTCLQNVFSTATPSQQGIPLALALCSRILEGKGAWRVHGGGFAGTILAFVPDSLLNEFQNSQDSLFGEGSCCALSIRPVGGVEVTENLMGGSNNG
jgi:galactokinase